MKLAGCLKDLKSGLILNFEGGISWLRNMSLERNFIGLMETKGIADIQQMLISQMLLPSGVTFPFANEFLSVLTLP